MLKETNWDSYKTELDGKRGLWFGIVNTPTDIKQELGVVN